MASGNCSAGARLRALAEQSPEIVALCNDLKIGYSITFLHFVQNMENPPASHDCIARKNILQDRKEKYFASHFTKSSLLRLYRCH